MVRRLVPVSVNFKDSVRRATLDETVVEILASGKADHLMADPIQSREIEFMVPPGKAVELARYIRERYGTRVTSIHAPGKPGYHYRKY